MGEATIEPWAELGKNPKCDESGAPRDESAESSLTRASEEQNASRAVRRTVIVSRVAGADGPPKPPQPVRWRRARSSAETCSWADHMV